MHPDNSFKLPDAINYSIIFCREVFEHLPNPLDSVEFFCDHLPPDGLLIFDYILSDAEGVDTQAGVDCRLAVIDFIKSNFEIVEGDVSDLSKSIGLTIAQKK